MSDMLERGLASLDARLDIEAAPSEGTPAQTPESDLPPAALDQVVDAPDSAEPAIPPTAETVETPEPQQDRPRDPETGQFISKEQAAQVAQGDPELQAFLDKYQGDPEKALRAAVEAQKKIGQMGSELGSTRQERDEVLERLSRIEGQLQQPAPPAAPAGPPSQQTVEWFEGQMENDPQGAAVWAASNDPSGVLLNQALDYWYDVNPRQASEFIMNARLQAQQRAFEERLKEQTAPFAEVATKNAIGEAWAAAREKFPDLDERTPHILEAAKLAPEVAEGLQSDDPAERVDAVTKLYYLGAGIAGLSAPAPTGGTPDNSAEAAAEALAAQARDAKLDGTVASQTTTTEPESVEAGEAWLRAIFDPVAARHQPEEFGPRT